MKVFSTKVFQKVGVAALALVPVLSMAALDTSVTTAIGDAKTDVLALGALVFGIAVAVKIYKWLRRAL